ncbi:hypothetical protein llap_6244 [Limosa lapponica baueri]|uniref:Uncharacterized protein n=1 Tax=Limosa lapponica baueri TaxID=1758121 RepID=A0A2I0UBK1_LIMLA|nr:hypothetical protein llap_6244 [Limosa lapponica baueri]
MNFADGMNQGSIINAEEDHNMTVARLDDLENYDHRNVAGSSTPEEKVNLYLIESYRVVKCELVLSH